MGTSKTNFKDKQKGSVIAPFFISKSLIVNDGDDAAWHSVLRG